MNKRIKYQRSHSRKFVGKPLATLRDKIQVFLEKLIDSLRESFYYEYFLQITMRSLIAPLIFLTIILVISVIMLVREFTNNDQLFVSILTASAAISGVILTIMGQAWLTQYKSRIEQQQEDSSKMVEYYEGIIQILNNPSNYSSKEIFKFIREFDRKVLIYGSDNIVEQWKRLNKKIITTRINPSNAKLRDLHAFRNFIGAIREEMGKTSSIEIRRYVLEDLKSHYTKSSKKDFQAAWMSWFDEVEQLESESPQYTRNSEKDFQAAWMSWFNEVEQLEPESSQLEPDEYGKALTNKYKKQGLDL